VLTPGSFTCALKDNFYHAVEFAPQQNGPLGMPDTHPALNRPQPDLAGAAAAQCFMLNGLFGWFHANGGVAEADVAVLICGTLSREALDSHHSLRVMADAFAQAGYPTMRFDYAGSGDSCDIDATADAPAEHWAIWQQNIHDVADALRRRTGARRLIFCGLRLGATLAAVAAERRDDVAALILLAPVLRGRAYLRQLQIEAGGVQGKATAKGVGLECHELSLSAKTVDLIGEADLRRVKLGAGLQAAIFSQTPTRPLSECVAAWAARAVTVHSFGFDGLAPLLCPDTQGYKEPAGSAEMLDWLNKAVPPQPYAGGRPMAFDAQDLHLPRCVETALRFGPEDRLFGILSRPAGNGGETAVIIVNTGRNPRTGVGRFGVEFARRLAAEGITALRFDFAGLGDSTGLPGEEDMRSDVFENDRSADISAAIDTLAQLGCRRFMVQGICSGAYHGLHAALTETRIEAVLMTNLPLFHWKAGDSIAESKKRSYSLSHYTTRMAGRAGWGRLLRGESDVVGILKGQTSRLAKLALGPLRKNGKTPQQDAAGFARKLMAGLSRRHVKTLFLFEPDHAGAYEIQSLFGKGGAGLKAFAGAEIQMVSGLGDAVGEAAARRMAADRMIDFIAAL
jgi:dienelactone hydrolase